MLLFLFLISVTVVIFMLVVSWHLWKECQSQKNMTEFFKDWLEMDVRRIEALEELVEKQIGREELES